MKLVKREAYKTDLNDAEWDILESLVPAPLTGGRPIRWSRREIVNAILYVLKAGCQWYLLPHDFPPYKTVYDYYRQWRRSGLWEQINTTLREKLRVERGRDPQPSAAIIDSQSVKTTEKGGIRGYDGGKKVKGRKRHILVDTQGFVLKVMVHTADIHDRDGGRLLLEQDVAKQFPRLRHLWVDLGYRGRFVRWVKETLHWSVEISKHWWQGIRSVWVSPGQEAPTYPVGFQVLKWRWIVERTLAWLNFNRRLSKDFELLPQTTETWIYLSMSRLMLRHLAKTKT